MKRRTYVITSTVCCFIVLLVVLGRYVYENDRLIKDLGDKTSMIRSLDDQHVLLQNNLEEANLEKLKLTQSNALLIEKTDELITMLQSVNQEAASLELAVDELKASLQTALTEKNEWAAQYADLDSLLNKDNYLADLIRNTAEMKTIIIEYEGILAKKNNNITRLNIEMDLMRAKSDSEVSSKRIIAELSQSVAEQRYLNMSLEKQLDEQEQVQALLNKKIDLYETSQRKLMSRYESQIVALKGSLKGLEKQMAGAVEENTILKSKLDQVVNLFTDQVDRINLTKSALDSEIERARQMISEELNSVILPPVRVSAANNMVFDESSMSGFDIPLSLSNDREASSRTVLPDDSLLRYDNVVGKSLEARVLSASPDTQDFVILDKGRRDGLRIGHVLDVWEDNTKIADLSIVQTREKVSAARIKNLLQGKFVREGYLARIR